MYHRGLDFPLDPSAVKMGEVTKTSTCWSHQDNQQHHNPMANVMPKGLDQWVIRDISEQKHSQSEEHNFLAPRTPTASPSQMKAKRKGKKKRKVYQPSYYRASGVCITEDQMKRKGKIFMKIIRAEEDRKQTKTAKRKGKKSLCDTSKGESSGTTSTINRRLFARNLGYAHSTQAQERWEESLRQTHWSHQENQQHHNPMANVIKLDQWATLVNKNTFKVKHTTF